MLQLFIIFFAVIFLVLSGVSAFIFSRNRKLSNFIGALGPAIAFPACIVPALIMLKNGKSYMLNLPWHIPYATFTIGVDALSAFFLVPVLILCGAGAVYGMKYMKPWLPSGRIGSNRLWFNLLEAGMIMVILSRDAILFIFAWEIMSIASFFLVTFDHEKKSVRNAGWIYLVATHLGTFFIIIVFVLLGKAGGSFLLAGTNVFHADASPYLFSIIFIMAVIGFGAKAGFVPFHVWLPEAHPAAPSHVSAVMSGVMIKMGIYGLLRVLTLLGSPVSWWGWLLIIIGAISGISGVLFALAQHDLKRLLAYHSVENIGIITMGLGLGILGLAHKNPFVAAFGFGGGILHVLNHAFFKGLLFLGSGAVAHETGTVELEKLGGLAKRMPWTAICFIIGSAAIAGLPPFNGFISEFLIYLGTLNFILPFSASATTASLIVILALVLIGGLAVACFTKAAGVVFSGEPRTEKAAGASEVSWYMRAPMVLLAGGCIGIAFFSPVVLLSLKNVLASFPGMQIAEISGPLKSSGTILIYISCIFAFIIVLNLLLWIIKKRLLKPEKIDTAPTWDCGYCKPSPKMQYTASSFGQPLTRLFHFILRTNIHADLPDKKLFPGKSFFETHTPDVFEKYIFAPIFLFFRKFSLSIRWIQLGRVQLYVLYIAVILLILLLWTFFK